MHDRYNVADRSYLEGVQLEHGHEGREKKQLLVGIADNPILLRLLATTQRTRLARVNQHPHTAEVVVVVQKLRPGYLDLVCDVCVAAG